MKVWFSPPPNNFSDLRKKSFKEVAQEFEAVLLKEVLKNAFRPLVNGKSFSQRLYYDMFLDSVSRQMAKAGGVGIADYLLKAYRKNQPLNGREDIKDFIVDILKKENLPEWLAFIPEVESSYDPKAVSHKGAVGLWQLMEGTARALGLRVDKEVDERLDPFKSTLAAVKYIKYLKEKFKSWTLVLIAYNWGEGNLRRLLEEVSNEEEILSRVPKETRDYVNKILSKAKDVRG